MSSQPLFHVTEILQSDTSYKSGAREGLQIIQTFTYDTENPKDGSKADEIVVIFPLPNNINI